MTTKLQADCWPAMRGAVGGGQPGPIHPVLAQTAIWNAFHLVGQQDPSRSKIRTGVEPISVELGSGLLELVVGTSAARLRTVGNGARQHLAREMGFPVPCIRVRNNPSLTRDAYLIRIRGVETAVGEVSAGSFLAIGPEELLARLDGKPAHDPAYRMPGRWIHPTQCHQAEAIGCWVFDAASVLMTHVTEVIRLSAARLLTSDSVRQLLKDLKETHPTTVDGLLPGRLSIPELRRVLQHLLRERVSIRDLGLVLETIADQLDEDRETVALGEAVRQALRQQISSACMDTQGTIRAITVEPALADLVLRGDLHSRTRVELLLEVTAAVSGCIATGIQPIVVTRPEVRWAFRCLTEEMFPNLVILSFAEVAPMVKVQSLGALQLSFSIPEPPDGPCSLG